MSGCWLIVLLSASSAPACEGCSLPERAAMARAQFQAGLRAHDQGELEEARAAFATAAQLSPRWGLVLVHWAQVELAQDANSATALELLERAVELEPDNPRAHFWLGIVLERRDQLERALAAFETTLSLRGTYPDAKFHRGSCLERQGKISEAIAAYRDILLDDPVHMGSLTALAGLYETTGQLEAAEGALWAIAEAQPNVAYHHYRLAEFYERVGKVSDAVAAYGRAEKLDPRPKRRMRELRRTR